LCPTPLYIWATDCDFGWGSAPDPAGGAYSAPQDPIAGFNGPTSKGKEGRGGKGKGWEEKGKWRGRKWVRGREGEGVDIAWHDL